ncbi:MAG: hypothetical protein QNK30_07715, partial [Bacteroidales bacterium]|nr:hypothetical protein [Bacteroidales bacterium]
MQKLLVILLISFCLSVPLVVAAESERPSCQVCGMYIDQYQKTTAKLEYKDGTVTQSCGLACLLRLVEDAGGPDAFT